jgi:D-glycero-D-manno-heptose 1,7-bisphosphate phosphatase
MNNIIFLDRDGVINIERGEYTYKIEDFIFVDTIFNNLKRLQKQGFQFIIITNQGGISRGVYNKKDVFTVHQYMVEEFKRQGVNILDIYFCPHHDTVEKCLCRKPLPLMIEKAIAKHKVNKNRSFLIGDNKRDITAAQKAGITGFLIEKNTDITPVIQQILTDE